MVMALDRCRALPVPKLTSCFIVIILWPQPLDAPVVIFDFPRRLLFPFLSYLSLCSRSLSLAVSGRDNKVIVRPLQLTELTYFRNRDIDIDIDMHYMMSSCVCVCVCTKK